MNQMFNAFAVVAVLTITGQTLAAQGAPTKPGPEHEKLGYFVGKWKTEGSVKAGPMGPAGKTSSIDDCQWFEGKFSVLCHYEGTTPNGPSKSIGILGYSIEDKAYTYYGVDNSAMAMASVPKGHLQGDTWTYTDESTVNGKPTKSRVHIKEISPTKYTFSLEIEGPDGKFVQVMESTSTKIK